MAIGYSGYRGGIGGLRGGFQQPQQMQMQRLQQMQQPQQMGQWSPALAQQAQMPQRPQWGGMEEQRLIEPQQQPIRTPPRFLRPPQRPQVLQEEFVPPQSVGIPAPRPYGGGPGFAKPLPTPPSAVGGGEGQGGGPPASWKMSIEPMADGGMIPDYHEGGNIPTHEHGEGEDQHLVGNRNPGPPWGMSVHSLQMTRQPLMADTLYTSPEGVEGFLADEARALRSGPTVRDLIAEESAMTEGLTGADKARAIAKRRFAQMDEEFASRRGGSPPVSGDGAYTPSHYERERILREYVARRRRGAMGDPTIGPMAGGGIIGLRGGGYMPPYAMAGGGEVPMVLVDGEYVPAYFLGGLWKGIKKAGKLALKAAPVAAMFIPGIGQQAWRQRKQPRKLELVRGIRDKLTRTHEVNLQVRLIYGVG